MLDFPSRRKDGCPMMAARYAVPSWMKSKARQSVYPCCAAVCASLGRDEELDDDDELDEDDDERVGPPEAGAPAVGPAAGVGVAVAVAICHCAIAAAVAVAAGVSSGVVSPGVGPAGAIVLSLCFLGLVLRSVAPSGLEAVVVSLGVAAGVSGGVAAATGVVSPRAARGKGPAPVLRCLVLGSREVSAPPIPDGRVLAECIGVCGLGAVLPFPVSACRFPGVAVWLGAFTGDGWAAFLLLQLVQTYRYVLFVGTCTGV